MKNKTLKISYILVLVMLSFLNGFSQGSSFKKYALVIGVKTYQHVPPLQNSLNDARDIATTLKTKGFQVIELYDPQTKREMLDGIRQYFQLLNAQKNAAGMVFYSGHGMQVDGLNYLIPTTADPQIKADLEDQCVNMDYVMKAIEEAGNGLNIFVIDACRNNPFRSFSRSADRGLSMVNTPEGSYIVYATKPGSVASDGTGRNGLFTSKLLKYINTPNLNIEQVFKRVAADVAAESNDAQRPWIASDYTGDFYFSENTQDKKGTTDLAKNNVQAEPIVKENKIQQDPFSRSQNKPSSDLVGVWSSNGRLVEFKEKGICILGGETCTYTISQGSVTITGFSSTALTFQYSVNGTVMTFNGYGQQIIYNKVENGSGVETQTNSVNVQEKGKLVGLWQSNTMGFQMTLMLNANGTGEFDGDAIRFSSQGNTLTISDVNGANPTAYSFIMQGNSLTLSGGDLQGRQITFSRN